MHGLWSRHIIDVSLPCLLVSLVPCILLNDVSFPGFLGSGFPAAPSGSEDSAVGVSWFDVSLSDFLS